MEAGSLFESVPNFSEGRRNEVIAAIEDAAKRTHVLDTDPDPDHNRVVISMAGGAQGLVEALLESAHAAVERIDMREHEGVHPWVGAADVMPIIPLGSASLDHCVELARELADRVWTELRVPVYLYGYATNRRLADIRAGRAGDPDIGGPQAHPSAGAACIGARDKLVAFNVLLPAMNLAEARHLARSIRESEGGLRGVQALAFELPGHRIQLSMNLTRLGVSSPAAVIEELRRRGVETGDQQLVGLCPAAVANGAAGGKLLEARMAAAAARAGARRCERRPDVEHSRLAERLNAEADALARMSVAQDEILAGAERAAALVPVLRAAEVLDEELETMLLVAARSLREAVGPQTAAQYPARMAALDRRL